jgi:hypothetical protein
MNSSQRVTFYAAGTLLLLLCLFPPAEIAYPLNDAVVFPSNSLEQSFQRAFIFQQPQLTLTSFEREHPQFAPFRLWNRNQLFLECLLVIGIAGALLLVLSADFTTKIQPTINQKLLAAFLVLLFGVGLFLLWFGWLGYLVSFLLRLALVLIILLLLFLFFSSFRNVARKGAIWMKGLVCLELILVGIWLASSATWFWKIVTT